MLNPSLNRKPLSQKAGALALLFGLCLLLPLAALRLPAQTSSGEFTGTIHDPSGAIVPNGTITVTNHKADTVDTTKSDAEGNFKFVALPVGEYELLVKKEGFSSYTAPITLVAGHALSININLYLGTIAQRVAVVADGAKAPLTAEGASQLNVGGNVTPAQLIPQSHVSPVYPAAAQAAGIEGDVLMRRSLGRMAVYSRCA